VFVLVFTFLNILLGVLQNLLKLCIVIGLTIGIIIGIEFFICKAVDRCAARDSPGIEADDVVAIEDGGAEDVFGGVGVINA
jgi:uncharacterized protein YneF (UPF0154 family)